MGKYPIVPETDVLLAATVHLLKRNVSPYQFSIPRGKGIDTAGTKKLLADAFREATGRQASFSSSGPDILGISDDEWWQIESKGAGSGTPSTLRNNFDRSLASVVSYYEENPPKFGDDKKSPLPFLGLALPDSPVYCRQLATRVRSPLRRRLNLWIWLYDPKEDSIVDISPEDDYPFGG